MRARVEKRSVLGWNKSPSLSLVIPPNPTPYPSLLGTSFWRSTCANHVIWTNTIYQDEIFYSSILDTSLYYQDDILAYHTAIETDLQTVPLNGNNPH